MDEYKGLKESFKDPTADHYEDKFEFTLWKMIRDYADKHDTSYSKAAPHVVHDYSMTTRIRDQEWSDAQIAARNSEGVAEVQDSKREIEAGDHTYGKE